MIKTKIVRVASTKFENSIEDALEKINKIITDENIDRGNIIEYKTENKYAQGYYPCIIIITISWWA